MYIPIFLVVFGVKVILYNTNSFGKSLRCCHVVVYCACAFENIEIIYIQQKNSKFKVDVP
jgi:hypothetical protein